MDIVATDIGNLLDRADRLPGHRSSSPVPVEIFSLRKAVTRRVLATALAAGVVCGQTTISNADTVRIQGSTTFNTHLLEPNKSAIESEAGHRLDVVANKSINGLVALVEGRADVAMLSAPLEVELKILHTTKPDFPHTMLRSFEIARTKVSLAVHPSNPVRAISRADLRRILLGDLTNWSDIGGPNLAIRIVAVREGGGVTATVQTQVLDGRPLATPGMIRLETPKQVLRVVEQEPGSLGLTQAALLVEHRHPELLLDKPIEQELHLVTFDAPTPAVKRVIDKLRTIARAKLM
jgi:phosphate transport system substrate-binding protein